MSDLTIALPAGFYRLGGFNDNGIDVYHDGSDGFSTEIGNFTNFDRLNENVNPFNPSLNRKEMDQFVSSRARRTATSYLLEVLSPRTPPLSPPSIPKSFTILNIEEIPIWIDTSDTPMTPIEQRDFFQPSNSPYSSPSYHRPARRHSTPNSRTPLSEIANPTTPTPTTGRSAPYTRRVVSMPTSTRHRVDITNSSSTGPIRGHRRVSGPRTSRL
ncbi:hypothetical protein CspHIS471_0402540 [Cutaneotrichosporon sp. HIS471]|nr:hypothetical protein CspHIS471_0402540 [Cutaneotrichosporon sp. HIS471]